jgi:hypothetical protein
MTARVAPPVAAPASVGVGAAEDRHPRPAPASRGTERPQLVEGVTAPVLFFRIYEMLAVVRRELDRGCLDAAALNRAADLFREARNGLHRTLSPTLARELDDLEPPLGARPTETEIRLSYAGVLGWLTALNPLVILRPSSADEAGGDSPEAPESTARHQTRPA